RELVERSAEICRHPRRELGPHFVMYVVTQPDSGLGRCLHRNRIRLALLEAEIGWNQLRGPPAELEPTHVEEQFFGSGECFRFIDGRFEIERLAGFFLADEIEQLFV